MAAFYLRGPPPPSASIAGHDARGEPFFSWCRLVRECCGFGFIVSYLLMFGLIISGAFSPSATGVMPMSTMPSPCTVCGARRGVYIQAGRTGLYWAVREGGVVVADDKEPSTVFRIEPVAGGNNSSFALRHLETLRLLTVSPPRVKDEYMLRLGPLRPETPYDLFTVQSLSIRSVGAGGYVNHRDRIHVRAHGNIEPWSPMQVESTTTRIVFRLASCENPYQVEDTFLGMVHKLQKRKQPSQSHISPGRRVDASTTRDAPRSILRKPQARPGLLRTS
ncbi:hypothetical protein T492DRAFT_1098198 [Pavlovales sp. CCMP2436]|nr:hypothetical protein T492DRAFT_1098198 [Pavlovales sp. CCMP2436]|mmetsp:Transcript_9662/g.24327  ORF Transcript_9662/g.24327 Transcript_9662/m.24327 type:complete len:277 (+) Transcript_9662:143-973(+)